LLFLVEGLFSVLFLVVLRRRRMGSLKSNDENEWVASTTARVGNAEMGRGGVKKNNTTTGTKRTGRMMMRG
jgi:hypothetical protein